MGGSSHAVDNSGSVLVGTIGRAEQGQAAELRRPAGDCDRLVRVPADVHAGRNPLDRPLLPQPPMAREEGVVGSELI